MAHEGSSSSSLPFEESRISSSKKTLWMGNLEPYMNEDYLCQIWSSYGHHVAVKLIRDKRTGVSLGYAFVEFRSVQHAQNALDTLQGASFPNMQKTFKLNWASGTGIHGQRDDRSSLYSLFVGDLCDDIDEAALFSLFHDIYSSCHSAKVMIDPSTGYSRGYGFVRFLDQNEQHDALRMNGALCGSRPIRISFATPRNTSSRFNQLALKAPALVQQATDPSNTTVFIGGLSVPVSEDELGLLFARFGEIVYVKIPPGKGCGFVQYVTRQAAENAIEQMNGYTIGPSRIRLSWGRSQNEKTTLPEQKFGVTSLFPASMPSSRSINKRPGSILQDGIHFNVATPYQDLYTNSFSDDEEYYKQKIAREPDLRWPSAMAQRQERLY